MPRSTALILEPSGSFEDIHGVADPDDATGVGDQVLPEHQLLPEPAALGQDLEWLLASFAGVLIGGGGTIAATEGKDVTLAPGTVLRVRLDDPLLVRP